VYRREFVGMEDCMQEVGRDEAKAGNMGIERLAGKKVGREGGCVGKMYLG